MRAPRFGKSVAIAAGVLVVTLLVVRQLYVQRIVRSALGDDLRGPLRAAERVVRLWSATHPSSSEIPDSLLEYDASGNRLRSGRTMLLARRGDSIVTIAAASDDGAAAPRVAAEWTKLPMYVRDAFTKARTSGTADAGLTVEHVLYATSSDSTTGRVLLREMDGDELTERMLGPIVWDVVVIGALLMFAIGYVSWRARAGELRREQELVALRSDFIAGVSHELRTPLAQIKLFAALLRDGALRDAGEQERARRIIEREAERLTILVDNVVTHARFSRRSSALPAGTAGAGQATDVARDVAQVIEAFAPLAAERSVTIVSRVPESLMAAIDSHALRQVLLNLVENAVKHGPDGQTVVVEGGIAEGRVRLSVTDAGPGIAAADSERIWLPFERGRRAAAEVNGSGIGLSVVRDLVAERGGKAWNESVDEGGSRFVVELPGRVLASG